MTESKRSVAKRRQRRTYEKALTEQVVKSILIEQMTVGKTSKLTGIPYSTVKDWVNRYKRIKENLTPVSVDLKAGDDEIHRLRNEINELKEENKSLEKSVFLLAKNQK